MNVLYIGYWGANEGLSEATIYPNLMTLAEMNSVTQIVYTSIERNNVYSYRVPKHQKIIHIPLSSLKSSVRLLNKVFEQTLISKKLIKITKQYETSLVICRSSLAGNYGLMIKKKLGVPFIVESFEPHADYMYNLGIWSRNGISFRYQSKKESIQKEQAEFLLPVSNNYRKKLLLEGIDGSKVITMPCAVKQENFAYSKQERIIVRKRLHINQDSTVGIYVGKFGGLYLEDEAFELFTFLLKNIDDFHLIILNNQSKNWVLKKFSRHGFSKDHLHHLLVKHDEVHTFLSAADFAFSLHRPSSVSYALSPIKNGEYWASGLPVLISKGIGDDSEILKESKFGIILDNQNRTKLPSLIENLINKRNYRREIPSLATKYRSFELVEATYNRILNSIAQAAN